MRQKVFYFIFDVKFIFYCLYIFTLKCTDIVKQPNFLFKTLYYQS